MYVCRTFESTDDEPLMSCFMIPAPNLLAEPSRPRARYARSAIFKSSKTEWMIVVHTWLLQRRFSQAARHCSCNRARPEQVYCFVLNASQAQYYRSTGPVSRFAQHSTCKLIVSCAEVEHSK